MEQTNNMLHGHGILGQILHGGVKVEAQAKGGLGPRRELEKTVVDVVVGIV
jgi:hypothetical protein